jgi:hypothetical protein
VEEGGRLATGEALYQRWCLAGLRDRSAAASELRRGRVRWRRRRKAGDGRSALPALVFGGPAGSLGGSFRIETRPRAVARKEEGGRRAQRFTSACVRRTCVGARLRWRQRKCLNEHSEQARTNTHTHTWYLTPDLSSAFQLFGEGGALKSRRKLSDRLW